jgi:hypothetical protein
MSPTTTSFDTLLTIEGIQDGQMIEIKRSALMARLIASHLPHQVPTGGMSESLKGSGMDANLPDFPEDQLLKAWQTQRPHFIQRMKAGGSPYLPSDDPEMGAILGYCHR